MADLEELVEEEKILLFDFGILNMSEQILRKVDGIISKNKEADVTISGEPYYQVYKNFDFWLKFNTQFSNEEKNIKLLFRF